MVSFPGLDESLLCVESPAETRQGVLAMHINLTLNGTKLDDDNDMRSTAMRGCRMETPVMDNQSKQQVTKKVV